MYTPEGNCFGRNHFPVFGYSMILLRPLSRLIWRSFASDAAILLRFLNHLHVNTSQRPGCCTQFVRAFGYFSPLGFVVQSSRINIQCRHQRKTWRHIAPDVLHRWRSSQVSGCFWFLGAFRILRKQWGPWTSTWTPPAMNSKWRGVDIQPLDSLM